MAEEFLLASPDNKKVPSFCELVIGCPNNREKSSQGKNEVGLQDGWVAEVPVAMSDDLDLIPRPYMVEGEN